MNVLLGKIKGSAALLYMEVEKKCMFISGLKSIYGQSGIMTLTANGYPRATTTAKRKPPRGYII